MYTTIEMDSDSHKPFLENYLMFEKQIFTTAEHDAFRNLYINLCKKLTVLPIEKLLRENNYSEQIQFVTISTIVDVKMQNSTTKIFFSKKTDKYLSLLNLSEHFRSYIGVYNSDLSSPIISLSIRELLPDELQEEIIKRELNHSTLCIELKAMYYGIKTLNKFKISELIKNA